MSNTIFTPAEVEALPVGQWVIDANGTARCLVNTNVGWPQRMFMTSSGSYTATDYVEYPLRLADLEDDFVCAHAWGTNECGHCRCCGQVVAQARELDWQFITLPSSVPQEGEKP